MVSNLFVHSAIINPQQCVTGVNLHCSQLGEEWISFLTFECEGGTGVCHHKIMTSIIIIEGSWHYNFIGQSVGLLFVFVILSDQYDGQFRFKCRKLQLYIDRRYNWAVDDEHLSKEGERGASIPSYPFVIRK